MTINRRGFLARTVAGVGLAATGLSGGALAQDGSLETQRRQAARRTRRIIFNNDGDDAWRATEPTTEAFLATRLAPCVDTQVDSVFYCTTEDTGAYTHRSKIAELFTRPHPGIPISSEVRLVEALAKQGTDVLQVALEFLHGHGKEVFWSHRMNGMEDMVAPFLLGKYKADHPEWWLGKPGDDAKYAGGDHRHWYKVFDYGVPQVREYVLSIIKEVIDNYDIDGVELDYLRDPWLFKETYSDPVVAVTEEHCGVMVDFHRRVRAMLDAKGRRVGRPVLLALRVPKWLELSRYLGLDIEATLDSGAVDILVGSGGYTPFAVPPRPFIDLAHSYGVPAYICISASGMRSRGKDSLRAEMPAWRGAATNLWDAGADGQYIFNTMPNEGELALQVMRQIGDLSTMADKQALFALDSWETVKDAGWCNLAINRDELLPVTVSDKDGALCDFYVGMDEGCLKRSQLSLRVYLRGAAETDRITIQLNGRALPTIEGEAVASEYVDIPLTADHVKGRINRLRARVEGAQARETPVELDHFELSVVPGSASDSVAGGRMM